MFSICSVVLTLSLSQAPEQGSDLRCGSFCLYVSLKALDFSVASFEEVEQRLGPPGGVGYSLGQLDEVAKDYGAYTLGVQTSPENLRRRPGRFACIARLDEAHFVNIAEIEDREAYVVDPPRRDFRLPLDTLRARWDGTALLISPDPLVPEEDLPRDFPLLLVLVLVGGGMLAVVGFTWMRHRHPKTGRGAP